jgi:hypothetical protein
MCTHETEVHWEVMIHAMGDREAWKRTQGDGLCRCTKLRWMLKKTDKKSTIQELLLHCEKGVGRGVTTL